MLTWNAAVVVVILCAVGCMGTQRPTDDAVNVRHDSVSGPALDRYASSETREIPDGDRRGILLGPVYTENDQSALGPIVLRLDIRHPATVDLDVRLGYDSDGDGWPEIEAPVEFYRSRLDLHGRPLDACPQSLDGVYLFLDGEEHEEEVFAGFQEAPRGKAFYLSVADTLAGVTGRVLGWEIDLESPQSAASPGVAPEAAVAARRVASPASIPSGSAEGQAE